jgi:excisionase family DNA binding protein
MSRTMPMGEAGMAPLTRLLTIKEVQAHTGLSDSSVRRAIRRRRLAVHRIGSVLRVSEADLLAFLKGCRRAAR